jgi:hypothetical protein
VLTQSERPLRDDERRDLTARLASARAESARALVKTAGAGVIVCGGLAVLTLLASDAPALVVLAFWAALWIALTLWIGLPWRKLMRRQIPVLENALRANRARVTRIQSARVVEFEEEEDEGACYVFALDEASAVFIVGQEFSGEEDFPNSDFSMVEILGVDGSPIDILLEKHGTTLQPERVVPAVVKWQFEAPEHLDVVEVPLERIESALKPVRAARR